MEVNEINRHKFNKTEERSQQVVEIYSYMWVEKKNQQNIWTIGVEMRHTGNLE